ncbi:hypothetical protein [Acetobacter aceti]|nr:hypothetical protein [Acetobacter aceti]
MMNISDVCGKMAGISGYKIDTGGDVSFRGMKPSDAGLRAYL